MLPLSLSLSLVVWLLLLLLLILCWSLRSEPGSLSLDAFPWAIWNQSQILDAHQSLEKAGCRAAETPPSLVDVDHPRPRCTFGRGVATLLPDLRA